MTAQTSVLYDAPGPKAKVRNIIYTVVFLVVFVAAAWWLIVQLNDKDQLDGAKWSPFFTSAGPWSDYLIPGLLNTLQAAALSIVIALPLGALLGILRLSDHKWISWPFGAIVELLRAIPVLIMMIFASGLYILLQVDSDWRPLLATVTGLVLYNSSVLAEVVRAGVQSLPKGQSEAGEALGLRKGQLMRSILLPQAVAAMLPAIVSQIVIIVKDTAIAGPIVNFEELINAARPLKSSSYQVSSLAALVVIALIFIIINFTLSMLAAWLEKWLRTRKKGTGASVGGGIAGGAPGMSMAEIEQEARAPRATGLDQGGGI